MKLFSTKFTVLVAALAILCAAPMATMAQEKAPPKKPELKAKHGEWEVHCQGENCGMQQVFKDQEGRPVVVMVLEKLKEPRKIEQGEIVAQARIITPLQVMLPKGLGISIDGAEATRRPYLFCNIQGCVVHTPVLATELEKMKSGKQLEFLTDLPGPKGPQLVKVPMSLEGFAKAYAEL